MVRSWNSCWETNMPDIAIQWDRASLARIDSVIRQEIALMNKEPAEIVKHAYIVFGQSGGQLPSPASAYGSSSPTRTVETRTVAAPGAGPKSPGCCSSCTRTSPRGFPPRPAAATRAG